MTKVSSWLLMFAGLVTVLLGFAGYYLTQDVERTILTASDRQVLGISEGSRTFEASFVIAGRDYDYPESAGAFVWRDGKRVRTHAATPVYGHRTDTILYVHIIGNRVHMVAIPRDTYLDSRRTKVNAMYYYGQAEALRQSVSELVRRPIDYYVVINIDIFEKIVDALGGVEVNVPYRMDYTDHAAGLVIDLQAGSQRLTGEQASGFVRYRNTPLGDYNRIDNVKMLTQAVLARVKELNVRAIGAVPELINTFFEDVETNVSMALIQGLLPNLGNLEIRAITLPTVEVQGTSNLSVNDREAQRLLAELFGGKEKEVTTAPEGTLLITNRSGVPGLEMWAQERLIALGIPESRLKVRVASSDPTPTRVLSNGRSWGDASYYSSLFHINQQQVIRFDEEAQRLSVGMELVLGTDAGALHPVQLFAQRRN